MQKRKKRKVIECFRCFIQEVKGDYFWFRGYPEKEKGDEFIAQAPKLIIRTIDFKWMKPGAFFDWIIYMDGNKPRSLLRFRKRYWKPEEIESAKKRTMKLIKALGTKNDRNTKQN